MTNTTVHSHNTSQSTNIHINTVSKIDKCNFVYHFSLIWNACPLRYRQLYKTAFSKTMQNTAFVSRFNIFDTYILY